MPTPVRPCIEFAERIELSEELGTAGFRAARAVNAAALPFLMPERAPDKIAALFDAATLLARALGQPSPRYRLGVRPCLHR